MMTNNQVESIGARVPSPHPPPPPPSFSSPKSSSKPIGGGCGHHSVRRKRFFSRNNASFERSLAPSRLMYFENDSWVDFSAEVVETLRIGFLERKPIVEALIGGAKYIFDLKRMLQIDCETGNCRSISWIDESGKCFFPFEFFSEEDNECDDDTSCNDKNKNNNCNHKFEIEVKIKRKREEDPEVNYSYKVQPLEEEGAEVQRLEERGAEVQRLVEGGAAKWPNTKLLMETEIQYLLVKDLLLNGIRKADAGVMVTAIHECKREGHLDKARLEVFQKQMEITKAARGTSNVVYAWFGASAKSVESILAHGFALPTKLPASDVYGVGVYLSPFGLPHLSAQLADADDNGVKHLILCRVILGNVEKVEAGSKQYHPSSVDFDTGSDNPNNPKWYVVWSTIANLHILPENVVSFKPSGNMQGQLGPVISVRHSLESLILKIMSTLPPAKVLEILMSYSTYKAGMVTKDAFLRRLREVSGDVVLRYAMQGINASG